MVICQLAIVKMTVKLTAVFDPENCEGARALRIFHLTAVNAVNVWLQKDPFLVLQFAREHKAWTQPWK